MEKGSIYKQLMRMPHYLFLIYPKQSNKIEFEIIYTFYCLDNETLYLLVPINFTGAESYLFGSEIKLKLNLIPNC
jgi:hypothetical protein